MIVPMKKCTIYAFQAERKELLSALQRRKLVMIINEGHSDSNDSPGGVKEGKGEAVLQSAAAALSFVNEYKQKEGMLKATPKLAYEELVEHVEEDVVLADKVLDIKNGIAACEVQIASLQSENTMLEPWLDLDISLNMIADTRLTRVRTGFFPERSISRIESVENEGGVIVLLGRSSQGVATLIFAHRDLDENVYSKAKEIDFVETSPPDGQDTARNIYDGNKKDIEELQAQVEKLKEEALHAAERIDLLRKLYDKKSTDLAVDSVAYETTDTLFYIEGWVRSDREDEVKAAVEGVTEYYALEIRDPLEEENPPTVTKNNKFITQFEEITDMFSFPGSRDKVDPNPLMGIWYWIIFGMMMGDVGYGLLMVVLFGGYKLLTKKNFKLVNILFYSGFTSIFWGIMFGSYFGEPIFPAVIVAPLDNIMLMMGICLGTGVLHIFSAMIMKMYISYKEGNPWDGVFDQLSGMLLVIGLVMIFLAPTPGKIIALIGGGTIILMGGRSAKGIAGRIGGGLMSLYNMLAGMLSDILSYCRILALMLSSGIVAMVMNILAGMVMPKAGSGIVGIILGLVFGIAIYVVGHLFNLVLSLLSAYVHDSRLQYLEFFGKFYDGGGYKFEPLAPKTKYTEVIEKETKVT